MRCSSDKEPVVNDCTSPVLTEQQWKMVIMDPPTREEASRIAEFLHYQTPPPRQNARLYMTAFKLCENEAHTGFSSAMVVGNKEEIVSVCTVTPKRLWHRGNKVAWAEIGDTFTSPAYLRKGMFGDLVNATRSRAEASGFNLIYGLPNDQSLPGYKKKLNFIVNSNIRLNDYYLLLNTLPLTKHARVASMPALVKTLSSQIFVKASRSVIGFILAKTRTQFSGFQVEIEHSFSDEFDKLWESVRDRLAIAQIRDSKYLRWRYGCSPFDFDFLVARKNGRLHGYIVTLTLKNDSYGGLAHTIIVDWLFDPEAKGTASMLLYAAIDIAYSKQADVISAMTSDSSPLTLPFSRCGFIRQFNPHPVIFFANQKGRELCGEASPWHFTTSDTDSF